MSTNSENFWSTYSIRVTHGNPPIQRFSDTILLNCSHDFITVGITFFSMLVGTRLKISEKWFLEFKPEVHVGFVQGEGGEASLKP